MPNPETDLLIVDGDLVIDDNACPALVDQRDSIAQDIQHSILASGMLISVVGERDSERRQYDYNRCEQLIETDMRIVPGTAHIEELDINTLLVVADTIDYNDRPVEFNLGLLS